MGYSTHGSIVWSKDDPIGHVYLYLSRVVEKTAAFTTKVIDALLLQLEADGLLRGTPEVVHWSDCGIHYRAAFLLGAFANNFPQRHKKSFHIKFGLEKHFKSWMDGIFGEMDCRIRGVETNRMLREVDDLVKVYREGSSASEHARRAFL